MNDTQPAALKCPQCGGDLRPTAEAFTICQFCGSSVVYQQRAAGAAGAAQDNPVEEKAVRGIRLKPLAIMDNEVTGMEVFHMLIPAGWQVKGGVRWLFDNPGMPAALSVQVWNPQGAEGFEVLPNMNFVPGGGLATLFNPQGSKYYGAEVRKPVAMREAFTQFILPRYRSWAEKLQLVNFELQPDLPRLVKSDALVTPNCSAEGGKARIRYSWHNQDYEEEIYGVVEIFRMPTPAAIGKPEVIVWFIDNLFAFRAGAGRLEANVDLFTMMITSLKANPEWYAAFKTIANQLIAKQIQHIKNIGEFGRAYAEAGSQARQQNLNDWYARQDVYDRLATDRSRSIRDVDGFYDPHKGEVVELPSGYGQAWANNNGEYIVTDNPNFNPNEQSNLHWEPMTPQ